MGQLYSHPQDLALPRCLIQAYDAQVEHFALHEDRSVSLRLGLLEVGRNDQTHRVQRDPWF